MMCDTKHIILIIERMALHFIYAHEEQHAHWREEDTI